MILAILRTAYADFLRRAVWRNWTEGLDRLPDLERQAIEVAITGRRK